MNKIINSNLYKQRYKNVFKGDKKWNTVKSPSGLTYKWNKKSTYVQHPPFFKNSELNSISDIKGANNLNLDCIFITDGVHRDEMNKISDLNKLLETHNVKIDFFQKELIW